MISYWEKQSLLHFDVAIIGGGITGLSAAISLKEKQPHLSVAIFERAVLPSGASTRNAGFACIGSAGEMLSDLANCDADDVLSIVEMRLKGLQMLRKRLGDNKIRYQENGSYELLAAEELLVLDKISWLNNLLYPVTKQQVFSIEDQGKIQEFGFSNRYFKAIVSNACEGELHTGEMMKNLLLCAAELGVQVFTGASITQIEETEQNVSIIVSRNVAEQTSCFTAKRVIAAVNAFTSQLFPKEQVLPGRGTVLITKPIAQLAFKGIFHFNEGYYYFREIDGRVLFGGGRNVDFKAETTTSFDINGKIYESLIEKLRNDILPTQIFEIDMTWSGIMAFGKNKKPELKWLSEKVFGAYKMGGMGVAIGSLAGEIAAENIVQSL